MKHIIPTLTLTTLAAASAVAQVAPSAASKSKFSYDRVAVSYSSSDANVDTVGFSASAEISNGVIVSATYGDVSTDFFDGKSVGIGLGYAQNVGPSGSILVGVTYTQLSDITNYAADGIGVGLSYRHALNSQVELNASVFHQEVDTSFGTTSDDTAFSLGIRFNVNQAVYLTAGYSFADDDFWSLSVGLDF